MIFSNSKKAVFQCFDEKKWGPFSPDLTFYCSFRSKKHTSVEFDRHQFLKNNFFCASLFKIASKIMHFSFESSPHLDLYYQIFPGSVFYLIKNQSVYCWITPLFYPVSRQTYTTFLGIKKNLIIAFHFNLQENIKYWRIKKVVLTKW